MVVLLVFQKLFILEIVLPDIIESHVVEIVAILARFPQDGILFFGKTSYDI